MKTIEELKKEPRLNITQIGLDGGMGWINLPISKRPLAVIFSNGGGWDHVSVAISYKRYAASRSCEKCCKNYNKECEERWDLVGKGLGKQKDN